jgi:hypothetical protein
MLLFRVIDIRSILKFVRNARGTQADSQSTVTI